jgi:hypothetical protein
LQQLVKGERHPDDKTPHNKVDYESPSTDPQRHCSLCEHYIRALVPRCMTVKNPIKAADKCKRFEYED